MFDMWWILLSIPWQETPSPQSALLVPTLLSCLTHLSSCSAGVWRQCSGSGRSGRGCGEKKRPMGCQHYTSPRLSRLTWVVTSAWRRAPNREPPFTSMWKVDKQKCPCLSASACKSFIEVFVCERAERELKSRARGNCCLSLQWQGAVCVGVFAEKGVCNFAQDRYSRYWSYLSALLSFSVFPPGCNSTSPWPSAISSGSYHELITIPTSPSEATSTCYFFNRLWCSIISHLFCWWACALFITLGQLRLLQLPLLCIDICFDKWVSLPSVLFGRYLCALTKWKANMWIYNRIVTVCHDLLSFFLYIYISCDCCAITALYLALQHCWPFFKSIKKCLVCISCSFAPCKNCRVTNEAHIYLYLCACKCSNVHKYLWGRFYYK